MKLRLQAPAKFPVWVVMLAMVIASAAYLLFVFLPFQKSIAGLRQQLSSKQLQIVQADQLALPLAEEEERLAEIRKHTTAWQRRAPGPQELAAFFARLSEQAHHAHVSLLKFDPQPPRSLQSLRQHAVILSVQGDFEQIFDFVTRIEKLPQTIWPTQLRLSQPQSDSTNLQCEMTLTIFGDYAGSAD